MSVALYTAIVGAPPRTDIKCLTGEGVFARPVMEAKRYKVLSHLFFPNDEITLWVDGNIWLHFDHREVAADLLGDADLAVFYHSYRKTVWQEFSTLRTDPRFAIEYLQRQLRAQQRSYREDGLPEDTQLFECNVLVRRNVPAVHAMMNTWWAEICRWQWRDQVSFPYALWKHPEVKIAPVIGNVRNHRLFNYVSQY